MRILVEVEDGMVVGVYCDNEDATVFIVDRDDPDDELIVDETAVDGGGADIDDILEDI